MKGITSAEKQIIDKLVFDAMRNPHFRQFLRWRDKMSLGARKKMRQFFHDRNTYVASGFSKAVIISDLLTNWVIKIPFFTNTPQSYYNDCITEVYNYQLAVKKGLDKYFAKTIHYGDLFGYCICLQEKCQMNISAIEEQLYFSYVKKYCNSNSNNDDDDDEYDDDYIYDAISELDTKEQLDFIFHSSDLVNFCYENRINDLHSNNIGFTQINRNPIIIDFSGYNCP